VSPGHGRSAQPLLVANSQSCWNRPLKNSVLSLQSESISRTAAPRSRRHAGGQIDSTRRESWNVARSPPPDSRRHRCLIQPTTVRLPSIRTDIRAAAVRLSARVRRAPIHARRESEDSAAIVQSVESRSVSMRIGRPAHTLGARRDGPMDASYRRLWHAPRRCRWRGPVSSVQSTDSVPHPTDIRQLGSRSPVSVPPRLGPFGPGFVGILDEKSRRYFRVVSARWRLKSVEGLRTIADRISRPGRMRSAHTPATMRSETRRLGERFRDRLRISSWCLTSTDSATTERAPPGTDEPGDCRQQMQKKDGQITHRTILARSRAPRNTREFRNSPGTGSHQPRASVGHSSTAEFTIAP
jgi:hypothetical protein